MCGTAQLRDDSYDVNPQSNTLFTLPLKWKKSLPDSAARSEFENSGEKKRRSMKRCQPFWNYSAKGSEKKKTLRLTCTNIGLKALHHL